MIRHAGRFHKRRARDIFTRDDADPRPPAGRAPMPAPRGPPSPLERGGKARLKRATRQSREGGLDAARAIMTTDPRPKHHAVRLETAAGVITVGGIAKGAGMIHPDMATLLAVLTTDAAAEPAQLAPLLRRVAHRTFNAAPVGRAPSAKDTGPAPAHRTA